MHLYLRSLITCLGYSIFFFPGSCCSCIAEAHVWTDARFKMCQGGGRDRTAATQCLYVLNVEASQTIQSVFLLNLALGDVRIWSPYGFVRLVAEKAIE